MELLLDAVLDTAKLIPFLFATLFLMEFLEHRASDKFTGLMTKSGKYGPVAGALLGCVPQCGFSAACSSLFNGGMITAGTLIAVFLSTSDEALPILISNAGFLPQLLKLLGLKIVIALFAGFFLDALWKPERQKTEFEATVEPHQNHCHSDGSWKHIVFAALKHMLSILLFIFLITIVLNFCMENLGEEKLASFLLPGPFQPVLTALIGLIPNCASSVLITQLYINGFLSFGSCCAGLCTASGIGMLVLLRGKRSFKAIAAVLGSTYIVSILAGIIIQSIA